MQAIFGLSREQHNKLFYESYENDSGIFHFHTPIELYFIDDGEMEVVVNDQSRILKKGEMSVALSYDAHAYRTPVYSKSSVLIIPSYMCEEFMLAVKNKKATAPFLCDQEAVRQIKDCIVQIQKAPLGSIKQTGYIYVILGILMEHLHLCTTKEPINTSLSSQLLFYINQHYKEELSLSTLAAKFGYSREHISRYFKSCFHIGIAQYIQMIRLKSALALMQENKHSITYCALESGFHSMRTFYRAFSEEFHCSPKDYLAQF